jgi:glycosyltransferase involved in cell wall biosynthesis
MIAASIIIPSYNGAKKLPALLASLEKQTYTAFEVIIIVDGSTDNTREVLNANNYKFDLKVVYQENKGRAGARNSGVKCARADVLVFIDDDIELGISSIYGHHDFHKNHLNCILAGTAVTKHEKHNSDFEEFKASIDKKRLLKLPQIGKIPITDLYLSAANFSIAKNTFHQIGKFDEMLADQEDFDFAIRSIRLDIPIYINQDIVGWHKDHITLESYILRQLEYKSATKLTLKLKPQYKIFYTDREHHCSIWKIPIYNVFSSKLFRNLSKKRLFLLIPQKIRFKFYELSIWGYVNYFPNRIK